MSESVTNHPYGVGIVHPGAHIYLGAVVESGAYIHLGAVVKSGAVVESNSKVIVCGPIGSRGARLTAYWCRTLAGEGVEFVTGCFVGTGEQLMAEAELTHGIGSRHAEDYAAAVELMTRLVLASLPPETAHASGRGE